MPSDQYNAFEGADENDPYANIRKMLSMKSPGSAGASMAGAPGAGSPGAPGAGITPVAGTPPASTPASTGGSYGSLPTAAQYSALSNPGTIGALPGGVGSTTPATTPSSGSAPGTAAATGSTSYPGTGTTQGQPQGPWSSTSSLQGYESGNAQNASNATNSLINQNEGILGFLSGPPQDSPLYTSLLSQANSAISNSYDSAVANTRENAEASGFGYQDPLTQGSEEGVRAQEAGALATAPSTALQTTVGEELQGAQLGEEEAGLYNTQNIADQGDITALQQSRNSKTSSMFASLMQMIDAMISGGAQAGSAALKP